VLLSGRVLAHAVPSLDSSATTTLRNVDFGTVALNSVTELPLRLFNRGYSSLQARLVRTAEYMVQVPQPVLVLGAQPQSTPEFTFAAPPATPITNAATYTLRFDATGGFADGLFAAELRVAPADEPLPGALGDDTLRVTLHAHIEGNGGVEGPLVLRFAAPRPNPLHRSTLFAFDLPQAAPVSLAVFDAGGRRVAQLVEGLQPAGRHQLAWRAAHEDGSSLPAGLYFARFVTPGMRRVARLALLP